MRFLLANLIRYDSRTPVDFHSVQDVIPDLEIPERWGQIRAMSGRRILKTHVVPLRGTRARRAIYVVRDGRDAVTSYYHYLLSNGGFAGDFEAFMRWRPPYGFWEEHVQRWLDLSRRHDVLWLRYEDMKSNPAVELRRAAAFLEIEVPPCAIEWAVDNASADQMRSVEEARGRPHSDGFAFVRKAVSGDWRTHFTHDLLRDFQARAGDVMRSVGYDKERPV